MNYLHIIISINLKAISKHLFEDLDRVSLFTLKFHVLDHTSDDMFGFGDLQRFDKPPFEHPVYTIKKGIRITSTRKSSFTEKAIKAMNESIEDRTSRGSNILNNRPTRFARDGFCIIPAGAEHGLHESVAQLTTDAKAFIFKCVFGHFQGVSSGARNMSLSTIILLTVVKTGYVCGGANIVHEDYDAVQKSIVIKRNIFNVAQKVFADGASGPAKCHRVSFVFVQVEGTLYWFAQLFYFST